MKIYLLRHGMTAYNAQKRYLGRSDVPLSPAGERTLCPGSLAPQQVYVSPMRRAVRTAEILFPEARQIEVPDLREMDFGIFEGKNYEEMAALPAYREWVEGGCQGKIPEGESKEAFCRRTNDAFCLLANRAAAAGEDVLVIVAHGGTQMAIMEQYADPKRDYFSWCGPYGGGFLLDASQWEAEQTLVLIETVQFTAPTELLSCQPQYHESN